MQFAVSHGEAAEAAAAATAAAPALAETLTPRHRLLRRKLSARARMRTPRHK